MCPRRRHPNQAKRWITGAIKLGGYACIGLFAVTVHVPYEMSKRVARKMHKDYREARAPLDRQEVLESLRKEAPTPSSHPPRRILPIIPSLRTQRKQSAAAQEQSPLFRLPPEVREIIWEYTVGHRFIYQPQPMDRSRRNPARNTRSKPHTRTICPGRTEYSWTWPQEAHIRAPWVWSTCQSYNHPGEGTMIRKQRHWSYSTLTNGQHIAPPRAACWYHEAEHWTGLNLLVTCRRIAEEVRPFMFRKNTFSFLFLEHLQVFRTYVGTSLLANIRYLHLDLLLAPGPYLGAVDRRSWEELWRLVPAEMTALRELDLEVQLPGWDALGMWLGWENIDGIVVSHFCESLPDWIDCLASLQGRLRRARLMCNAKEQHGGNHYVNEILPKIQDRLIEMHAAITMDGTGGWMELDPWWKHLEWKKAAVELESNESPPEGTAADTGPPRTASSSEGDSTISVPDADVWKRWMQTSPASLQNMVYWNAATQVQSH